MIGLAMRTWEDDELRRVVDAPLEDWNMRFYGEVGWRGPCCLVGHALDLRAVDTDAWREERWQEVSIAACGLTDRFGLPRTVRCVKARAMSELEARDPSLGEPTPQVGEAVGA